MRRSQPLNLYSLIYFNAYNYRHDENFSAACIIPHLIRLLIYVSANDLPLRAALFTAFTRKCRRQISTPASGSLRLYLRRGDHVAMPH